MNFSSEVVSIMVGFIAIGTVLWRLATSLEELKGDIRVLRLHDTRITELHSELETCWAKLHHLEIKYTQLIAIVNLKGCVPGDMKQGEGESSQSFY